MLKTLTYPRLLTGLVLLWAVVLSLTSQPTQAQTLNRAVFADYDFAFDYPQDYLLSQESNERLYIQYPFEQLGDLEPIYMDIRFPDVADVQTAVDNYMQEYPIANAQIAEGSIGGQTATIVNGKLWAFERRIGFTYANGRVYQFELTPDDPTIAPRETELADMMWDTIVGSVDFSPPELENTDSDCEDDSAFVEDVTIPDGTPVQISIPFIKTWRLNNDGTCAWNSSYQLETIYTTGAWENMTFASPVIPYTEPGDDALITTVLLLPPEYRYTDETHIAQFQLVNPAGENFGTRPYVEVLPLIDHTPPPTVVPSDNHPGMLIESFTVAAVGNNMLEVNFVVHSDSQILSTEIAWTDDNGQTQTRIVTTEGGMTSPLDMTTMAGYDLGEPLTLIVTSQSDGIGSITRTPTILPTP